MPQKEKEAHKSIKVQRNKALITTALAEVLAKTGIIGIKITSYAYYEAKKKEYVAVIRINGDRAAYFHHNPFHLIETLYKVVAPALPTMAIHIKNMRKAKRDALLSKRKKNKALLAA